MLTLQMNQLQKELTDTLLFENIWNLEGESEYQLWSMMTVDKLTQLSRSFLPQSGKFNYVISMVSELSKKCLQELKMN